jgi:hypothetical protein
VTVAGETPSLHLSMSSTESRPAVPATVNVERPSGIGRMSGMSHGRVPPLTAARSQGWADAAWSLDWLRGEARRLGWAEVATRNGDATVTELRPVTPEHARPRSLSNAVGLGQQPLHTDGAHLRRPPDIVAPFAELVLALRSSMDMSREWLQPGRGWTDEEWAAVESRLMARGLLDDTGAVTAAGR